MAGVVIGSLVFVGIVLALVYMFAFKGAAMSAPLLATAVPEAGVGANKK